MAFKLKDTSAASRKPPANLAAFFMPLDLAPPSHPMRNAHGSPY